MNRTFWIGSAALFVVWNAMDFAIHGVLLGPVYQSTAPLWRPMGEMKFGVLYGTVLVAALSFTFIYLKGFAGGPLQRSLTFGLVYGLGVGFSMGFGTFAVQPVPISLALGWLLGTVAEVLVGALLLHWIAGRFGTPARA